MKKWYLGVLVLVLISGPSVYGKQLYGSDFEGEALKSTPAGWTQVFKGTGEATVIADPLNSNNKILSSSAQAANGARHDVGGSIYGVGDNTWKDYLVEYDAYFPEDFYMGVVFRIQDGDNFYLFDRRSAGEAGNFDFWKRAAGAWAGVQRAGKFQADPKKWYRFRLNIKGDTFEAYAKEAKDTSEFRQMKPFLAGSEGGYKTGGFGLYGLIYVDNLVVGETEADLVLAVNPQGRLATTWAQLKEAR